VQICWTGGSGLELMFRLYLNLSLRKEAIIGICNLLSRYATASFLLHAFLPQTYRPQPPMVESSHLSWRSWDLLPFSSCSDHGICFIHLPSFLPKAGIIHILLIYLSPANYTSIIYRSLFSLQTSTSLLTPATHGSLSLAVH
jgi:hypothetical protein